ncbi:type II toxin-antitoxin system RelE/ParE family toxin [Sphingomonas sp. MA1305]|uniref:type II toxin-antitoxin system RelE/ParE family toxin n=1 Tax=Sphingomonas sp. MA1305 TaxID=2479204 RepID=UPI0018DFD596|nr:type II toxin-antitoxin system RelE/ParE family toxin [Sphingomonas sp. MA1305]MBI0473769.1 type II toxin-antitoxin system RelE/ParE family toxin [Sphingomonas sp. MA1305]
MRVKWTLPALGDIRGIDEWLSKEANPGVALRLISAVRARAAFLRDFPRAGRPLPSGHRLLRVRNSPYLLRYRIVGNAVEVLRVHHEREDWQLPS